MALIFDNMIVEALVGQLGGQFIFRKRKGKTIVSKRPARRASLSEAQQRHISRFREAIFYAKSALCDEEIRKGYEANAQASDRLVSAYNVAIADYLHVPVIKHVDLSEYRGRLCDEILVCATDDFGVEGVMIEIFKGDGSLLEVGVGNRAANGLDWVYYGQSVNDLPEGCKVVVRVWDLPGNVVEQVKVIEN